MLLFAAAASFYRSPYNASNFTLIPDSVEYASGGFNIADAGRYKIEINGKQLPPRYPPWFSLLIAAPSYLIAGDEPGNPIYAVLLFALIGVVAAYSIGTQMFGIGGGVLLASIIMASPLYRHYAREVMADVPACALMLLACALYLRITSGRYTTARLTWLSAGITIAFALSAPYF